MAKSLDAIRLDDFLPFRLSILSNTLSGAIARVYADRYDLTMPEWRILCVLAEGAPLAAREVAERTRMDKVMVSRAVARLLAAGRIARDTDASDRRRSPLTLSAAGAALYREVAPVARKVEADLLESLAPAERVTLDRLLTRMTDAAGHIADTPPSSTSSAPVMKPLSSDAR
jgi:DNA-binding MarR family transcriptional regulator